MTKIDIAGLLTEEDKADLYKALTAVDKAAAGDSNDREIEALNDALDTALSILGYEHEPADEDDEEND